MWRVLNVYITVPVKEKVWTFLGPEHGEEAGKWALIVRALYGLKSSGATVRTHLCECMTALGYKPCLADPDVWLKTQITDGIEYYLYILCYVENIMVIHADAVPVLNRIDMYMKLKVGSVGDPAIYLGAKLRKVTMDGQW